VKHATLLQLRMRHDYYADGRCADFAIAFSDDTTRLLRGHRLVVGTNADGFSIRTPLDASGQPFLPLPVDSVLRFSLLLRNQDFPLFTDLSAVSAQPAPLYSNAGAASGAEGALVLSARAPGAALSAPGVFADVELHPGSAGRAVSAPPAIFQLSFPAKQVRWAYYCVNDVAPGPAELHIVDASPSGTPNLLQFGDGNRTKLDEHPDPSDPIAVQLGSRYPNLRCTRFISDQSVACRKEPRKYLELRLGDERLAGPLPNPSLRSAAQEGQLFHVIRYRTQPFSNQ